MGIEVLVYGVLVYLFGLSIGVMIGKSGRK